MDGLKQRIIGALVLVSLAVIFVPMIFDEPHTQRQSTPITIPEEPPFPEVDMPDAGYPESEADGSADPSNEPSGGFRIVEEESAVVDAEPSASDPEPDASAQPAEQPEPEPSPDDGVALTADASEGSAKAEFSGSLDGAWVVQLGSFGNEDNARRLRNNVIEMGYGAHLQQVQRGESTLTRVFSGPFVEKSDAQAAKEALDKAFGLSSLVTTGDK
ncbi:SPOR domain-containing protein [Marinobacter sp. VGCF2001]|uniref:SPOR domain-containing protein n=1 Tax=Marinobacter sp. VGCF2001 TaxID=3417189 RepID=UPI003CE90D3E